MTRRLDDRERSGKQPADASLWRLVIVLNIAALPVQVLIGTMLAGQCSVPWSWRHFVGFVIGTVTTLLALYAWRQNRRIGAAIQLFLLLPVVIPSALAPGSGWEGWEAGTIRDGRFLFGLMIAVVIPASLTAVSLFALLRSQNDS